MCLFFFFVHFEGDSLCFYGQNHSHSKKSDIDQIELLAHIDLQTLAG